jgi:hypothetical protein
MMCEWPEEWVDKALAIQEEINSNKEYFYVGNRVAERFREEGFIVGSEEIEWLNPPSETMTFCIPFYAWVVEA